MNMISLRLPVYIALCQFWKIKIGSIKVCHSLPEASLQNLEKQQMFILHKPLIQKTFKGKNNYYTPQKLKYLGPKFPHFSVHYSFCNLLANHCLFPLSNSKKKWECIGYNWETLPSWRSDRTESSLGTP